MKLAKLPYEPAGVLDFYEDGLAALGALCSRPWHDQLEVVAEGRAAALWNSSGALHSAELRFAAADAASARAAANDVFPGCPLTFRLAEALRPSPLPLERVVLASEPHGRPPDPAVAEKLWRGQFADTTLWRIETPFVSALHFSLVALARCEIQAIDQHWSLHRVAMELLGGLRDEDLAREIGFAQTAPRLAMEVGWPVPEPARWSVLLARALEEELEEEIAGIRARQESSLRRELDRTDDYFEDYARELGARMARGTSEASKEKIGGRLAAAKAEHARHRADQVARHEIYIRPHIDALLLVAEPAWQAKIRVGRSHRVEVTTATFVPRSRRWSVT